MRITPRSEFRVLSHIFIGHIQPSGEGNHTIDHDCLAMVAQIDLETVFGQAMCFFVGDLNSAITQRADIGFCQFRAANPVIKKAYLYTCCRFGQQFILQTIAKAVIADGVILNKNVPFCVVNGSKDRFKGRLPVDQHRHPVSRDNRDLCKLFQCLHMRQPCDLWFILGLQRLKPCYNLGHLLACVDITIIFGVAEEKIRWYRDHRRCHQKNDPANRSLRRSRKFNGTPRHQKCYNFQQ